MLCTVMDPSLLRRADDGMGSGRLLLDMLGCHLLGFCSMFLVGLAEDLRVVCLVSKRLQGCVIHLLLLHDRRLGIMAYLDRILELRGPIGGILGPSVVRCASSKA